ncbi:MAG: hypothetical protein KDI31_00455 [Pseudomonadales bacterium]|nr:hypothetical protein [Pseudomonadales bacterium]
MLRIELKRGLDVPLGARPSARRSHSPARVALLGADFPGLRPDLLVAEGDRVRAGSVLLTDRTRPEIRLTSPVTGSVREIRRGARRSLDALVLDVEESTDGASALPPPPATDSEPEVIRRALQLAGLWSAFRARPFERIPAADTTPAQLFVTAMDTNPLSVDPLTVIREHADAFDLGLRIVTRLSPVTWLCSAAGSAPGCPHLTGLEQIEFSGPHPAGLPGTHMHTLAVRRTAESASGELWHIGYADVIAIGEYFGSGRLSGRRLISVAGPGLPENQLVETLAGACLQDLIEGSIAARHGSATGIAGNLRVLSGPPLSGRLTTPASAYLGRYHQQVTVLPPAAVTPPATSTGMLAVEAFDSIWPLSIPVAPLLRALLLEDTESAAELGAGLLAPEDLALCDYVCPARQDYSTALSRMLEGLRRDG